MANFDLEEKKAGLLVIDVQEKLFDKVERAPEVIQKMMQMIRGAKILELPIIATEQYPKGLGHSVSAVRGLLGEDFKYIEKSTFSCFGENKFVEKINSLPVTQWILVGIEAHVCILQTAKDLLKAGKQVVVLNDAISSRSPLDLLTAIEEMRNCGARISSTETVIFELVKNSASPIFKEIIKIIK